MALYIAYLAPLIITGITGISLISIAFNKVGKSIEDTYSKIKSTSQLGLAGPSQEEIDENKNQNLRRFVEIEDLVIVLFAISEIFVIIPFVCSLWSDLFSISQVYNDVNVFLIAISYFTVLVGFLFSIYVYRCAVMLNKDSLPLGPYLENEEERKRIAANLPKRC